jgi:hypothetical protein
MTYCCVSQGASHGSEQYELLSCIWAYMIGFQSSVIMARSFKFYSTFQFEFLPQAGNSVENTIPAVSTQDYIIC